MKIVIRSYVLIVKGGPVIAVGGRRDVTAPE
jgi:hypothetical protein